MLKIGQNIRIPGSDEIIEVKLKTDQSAMQEFCPIHSLGELRGNYQPIGEILGVTDSTNSGADGATPPATKRHATTGNTLLVLTSDAVVHS